MTRFVVRTLSCWGVVVCAALIAPPAVAAPSDDRPVVAERAGGAQIVPVAGTGSAGYSGDGQAATEARVGEDIRIAVGPDGTLYIADQWSKRVRAVDGDGVIDTVPGTRALRSPRTDGPEVNGWQYSPSDAPRAVAVGPDGSLYVAGLQTVRRLGRGGVSTTLATTDTGLIDDPDDIGVDAAGNVYVSGSGQIIKIDRARKVKRIGGGGKLEPLEADGKPATQVRLGELFVRFAVDRRGTVYVTAPHNSGVEGVSLHRIDPDGTLHTVAGGGKSGFSGDGRPARDAQLGDVLGGIAVDADGDVYVHDKGNGLVRVIGADGVITSLAPPLPVEASYRPGDTDLAIAPGGDVYVGLGARVFKVIRNGKAPARGSAREPDYPARFPDARPGTVQTVAGSGRTPEPTEPDVPASDGVIEHELRIAVGPDGARYYSDSAHHRVMKVAADGTGSVFAGTGEHGFSGDGGKADRAALNAPTGLDVDRNGNVYIADSGNFRLRKVDPAGVITTVAGNGAQGERGGSFGEDVTVHGDGGPATSATVTPLDVAVAPDGSLYIAEGENGRISRLTPDGKIRTFAGNGDRWMADADGHPAAEADFFQPSAVAVGRGGRVYVLDDEVLSVRPVVRMIDPNGILRTVAGNSYRDENEAGFGGDGGPGAKAELNNPHDIATGPDGTLYIADTHNARIRAVNAAGTIRTVAGTGRPVDSGDDAAATKAAVNEPQTIDVDERGAVHAINLPGDRIREIDGGTITTAGTIVPADKESATAGTPATKTAVGPTGLAVDRDGTLLVANQIAPMVAVAPDGMLGRPFAGKPDDPAAVAVGPDGTRYAADFGPGAVGVAYEVPSDGPAVPVAGGGPQAIPRTIVGDRVEPDQPATLASFRDVADLAVSDRLYIATSGAVYRLDGDGTLATVFTLDKRAEGYPDRKVNGIAVDREKRLYVAVSADNRVYRVDAEGERTTFAGNGSSGSEEDDNGAAATDAVVYGPSDVAVDRGGNVYIGTYDGIRRVGTDGTILTVAGNEPDADGGRMAIGPLAVDRHGDLYFADPMRKQVKVLVQPAQITEPFPWGTVIWIAVGVLVVGAAAWFGLRWWRRRPDSESTEDEPATDTQPAEPEPDTEPDTEPESDTDPDADSESAGDERA